MNYQFKRKNIIYILTLCMLLSLTSIATAQGGSAQVGVLEPAQVPLGASIQVPVSVDNVQDLYALDITLKFDPAVLQVEDADPSTPGIQLALGQFLDPGLMLFNSADNEAGTIRFAMSQYSPSEGKSGKGIVFIIRFVGKAEGETPLTVTELVLSDKNGVEIPSEGVDATLTVSAGAPTQAATYPVVEPTGLIFLNTYTPTPFPTLTPIPTLVPTKTPVIEKVNPTAVQSGTENGTGTNSSSGYFLANNWWIVLILLAVVIAAGVYYFVIRKKTK